jgi:hypothetical protein
MKNIPFILALALLSACGQAPAPSEALTPLHSAESDSLENPKSALNTYTVEITTDWAASGPSTFSLALFVDLDTPEEQQLVLALQPLGIGQSVSYTLTGETIAARTNGTGQSGVTLSAPYQTVLVRLYKNGALDQSQTLMNGAASVLFPNI